MSHSISLLENLRGRQLFLKLPDDEREVLRHARFFNLFQGEVELVMSGSPLVEQLLALTGCPITFTNNTSSTEEHLLSYDAAKLQFFVKEKAPSVPYMFVPVSARHKARQNFGNNKKSIGLCFDGGPDVYEAILSRFTMNQLLNFNFCIFSQSPVPFNKNILRHVDLLHISLETEGVEVTAALLEKQHLVLAQENLFAHLAAALGKNVWLISSPGDNPERIAAFKRSYPASTIVHAEGKDPCSAVQKISLFHYFTMADHFSPFNTGCRSGINQDVTTIGHLDINSTDEIGKILDLHVPCLNNVQIETTTVCNLACGYCPNSTVGREQTRMETETYHRIIDSLAEYLPQYTGTISPHFYGEPLTDERLEHFVEYARAKLPSSVIELYTNGELLDAHRFLALKKAGVDLFRISQHTDVPSQTLQECLTYVQRHHPELFTIDYKVFHETPFKMNRGGLVTATEAPEELMKQAVGCSMAHRVMTFDYKGNALLCCNDYLSQHSFGNIQENSVQEIWEGSLYQRIRNAIMIGYLPYLMCRKCMWITEQ